MTSGIKDELIEDIQRICKKFGIEIAIDDYDKDELTAEQYDNLKFPQYLSQKCFSNRF